MADSGEPSFNLLQALDDFDEYSPLQKPLLDYINTSQSWQQIIKVIKQNDDEEIATKCFRLLATKLKLDAYQLSSEQFQNLATFVKQYMQSKIVFTRPTQTILVNVVTYIIIHTYDQNMDLVQLLSDWFDKQNLKNYQFQILLNIVNKIKDESLVITKELKENWKDYFIEIRKQVLVFLRDVEVNLLSKHHLSTLFECTKVWIEDYQQDDFASLHTHAVLMKAFEDQKQENDPLFQSGILIKEVIELLNHPNSYPLLFDYVYSEIMQLEQQIGMLQEDQEDKKDRIIEFVLYFAKVLRKHLIKNPSQKFANLLAKVGEYMENKRIQNNKIKLFLANFSHNFLLTLEHYPEKFSQHSPRVKQIIQYIIEITQFTQQQVDQLNNNNLSELAKQSQSMQYKQKFNDFAQQMIPKVIKVVSPCQYLLFVGQKILNIDEQSQNYFILLESYLSWISKFQLFKDQNTQQNFGLVEQIIEKIFKIDTQVVIVGHTIMTFISDAMILFSKINNQISLKIVTYISKYLKTSLKTKARSEIRNICVKNKQYFLNNVQVFMTIYRDNTASQYLIEGLIKALSYNNQKLKYYLPQFFQQTKKIFEKEELSKRNTGVKIFVSIFSKLFDCKVVGCEQAISQLFLKFWKLVRPTLQKQCLNKKQQNILQNSVKAIKYALRTLRQHGEPFLQQIFQVVVDSYEKYPSSSYIYLVEVFVTVSEHFPNQIELITNTFNRITQKSLDYFQKQQIQTTQFLFEDFVGMINRYIKYSPQTFNNFVDIERVIDFVFREGVIASKYLVNINALIVDLYKQYWPHHLVIQWIQAYQPVDDKIIELTPELTESREKIKPLILKYSAELLATIIKVIRQQKIQKKEIQLFSDILFAQLKAFPEQMKQLWVKQFEKIPNHVFLQSEKQKYMQYLTILNYPSLEECILTFTNRCNQNKKYELDK